MIFSFFKNKKWQFLFFLTLFIWCFALAYPLNPDYDIFARLIVGKSIIENGIVLKHDFYSYTPTHLWLDHEWGASTIIYCVSKLANLFKIHTLYILSAFKSLLIFTIFAIATICVTIKNPKFSPYNILYFTLAVLASNIVFASTVRCHMFTFLFFALFVLILELYRKYKKKYLLSLLPILMLIWGNTHGGCLSGIGLLLIYSIGEALNKKSPTLYILTLIVSIAVLFVNPYGPEYVKFLFYAGTMNREWISEWASPFVNPFIFYALKFKLYFVFMIIIGIIKTFENKFDIKSADKTKLLLIVSTAYLAIIHTKLLPFFVISSAIFMFDDVLTVLNKFIPFKKLLNPQNKYVFAVILLMSLCVFQLNSYAPTASKNAVGVTDNYLPYRAIEFLKINNIKGNLLVDMSYGSYAAYRLYPDNKIFMDGRYEEVYAPDLLLELKDFFTMNGNNFDKILTKYPTDIILLQKEYTEKLSEFLRGKSWRDIYSDRNFCIFVSPNYPKTTEEKVFFDSKTMFDTQITAHLLKSLNNETF